MIDPARVVILIPTYNEALNIPLILSSVSEDMPAATVLVIDDNSPDGTGRVVEALRSQYQTLRVMHRRRQPGFAQSYIDGMRRVLADTSFDVIVTMDADFSHDPREILAMLRLIDGGADLVIGSRYARARNFSRIPRWRRLLSRLANRYVQVVLQLPITDCTAGFTVWRRGALAQINLTAVPTEGYGFLFALKHQAHRRGLAIREHPVDWPDRHLGESKMNFKRIAESARLPWRILFTARRRSSLTTVPHETKLRQRHNERAAIR